MSGMAAVTGSPGRAIKDARERRHLTQQQLADILGVDRKTVDNWEHGRTSPRNRMGALVAWAPELGGGESDAERHKERLHTSIDRLDAVKLARMVEALERIENGSTGPRERAG